MAFLGGGHPELSTCEGCFPLGFSQPARGKLTILNVYIERFNNVNWQYVTNVFLSAFVETFIK
jgi:hypothetical protein